jgi:hypothetical protein
VTVAFGIETGKRSNQTLELIGRDSGPVVSDRELQAAGTPLSGQLDMR